MKSDGAEARGELMRFFEKTADSDVLHSIQEQNELERLVASVSTDIASAIIPLEQATRTPKILMESGVSKSGVKWRLVKCPGGPVVMQLVCEQANIALWIQEC